MRKPPEVLHRRTLAETRLFRVEGVGLRFANETEVEFERVTPTAAGAVIVVPVHDDGTVVLVREYAAGTERYELGLPKGRLEPAEAAADGAQRELREEIGHGARTLTVLRTLTLAPGYLSHRTHVVLAEGLYPAPLTGDEPEPLEIVTWPLEAVEALLAREDFSEARSMAALFMARSRLRQLDKRRTIRASLNKGENQ